jgi:hypothetical protein
MRVPVLVSEDGNTIASLLMAESILCLYGAVSSKILNSDGGLFGLKCESKTI